MDDVFRNTVLKSVPGLNREDIETKYERDLVCPECGKQEKGNGAGALFYRIKGDSEWVQVGEPFKCSNCRDAEAFQVYMAGSLEEQQQQINKRLIKEYFLLPEKLKDAGFKNFELNDFNLLIKAKSDCINHVKSFLAGKKYNLWLSGPTGVGKSHLSAAVVRTIKEEGYSVGFLTTGQLLSKIKSTYNSGSVRTEEDILNDIKKIDLLCLDDLGSESIGGNDNWRMSMLFQIVEARSGKPSIYTSNMAEIELAKAVGDRVYSRLYDNTKTIDIWIENYDYRKKLQIK